MSTRRSEYTERTRRAIARSARRVFARHGYQAASIAEIARLARLSPGALYKHYSSKEVLFGAVAEEIQRELFEEARKAASSFPDPLERLRAAGRVFIESCGRPEVVQIIWVDYASVLGEEAWRAERPSYTVEVLRELLGALAAESRLQVGSVEAAAQMLFGAMAEGARWIAGEGTEAAKKAVEEFLEAVVGALVVPGPERGKKTRRGA